jgi:hypothetical protein
MVKILGANVPNLVAWRPETWKVWTLAVCLEQTVGSVKHVLQLILQLQSVVRQSCRYQHCCATIILSNLAVTSFICCLYYLA